MVVSQLSRAVPHFRGRLVGVGAGSRAPAGAARHVLARLGKAFFCLPAIVLIVLLPAAGQADPVSGLTEFSAGMTARAADVNGNFEAVAAAVDDNDARVAALEAAVELLSANVLALESDRETLRAQLDAVLNVAPFLSLESVNGQPAVRITGANLQIVNGEGATASANGTGNVIVGYDEERDSGSSECSLGFNADTETVVGDEADCAAAGGVFALNHKTGSHYLIVGSEHNYSRWGGIVVARRNTSNFDFASVSGGRGNVASGPGSSVSGGFVNHAQGSEASISGGGDNRASALLSSVSGGTGNTANGNGSSVSGGRDNTAKGAISSIGGGVFNSATAAYASVSGGQQNSATAESASVSGGLGRTADSDGEWVAGSLQEAN